MLSGRPGDMVICKSTGIPRDHPLSEICAHDLCRTLRGLVRRRVSWQVSRRELAHLLVVPAGPI